MRRKGDMKKNQGQGAGDVLEKRLSLTRFKTGASVAALVAAVALFVILIQIEKGIMTQYEKGIIYMAVNEIPKGQMITGDNYQQYVVAGEMDKKLIPDTALMAPEQIQGLTAVFDVEPGVLLTRGMFEGKEDVLGDMAEPVIAGFKAEDIYQVVGGTLRTGDRVHIYMVKEGEAVLTWEAVYIQQVFDASGSSIPNTDKATAAQRINIYLDKKQIEEFYTGLSEGSLRVVKICDGS